MPQTIHHLTSKFYPTSGVSWGIFRECSVSGGETDKVSLFAKNEKILKTDYIRVWDVIELLSKKADPNNKWYEVGQYLGHINIDEIFDIYHLNNFKQLNMLDSLESRRLFNELIDKLMSTLFQDEEDLKKIVNSAKWKAFSYYWKKTQVFSSEQFKEINLFNQNVVIENKVITSLFDDNTYLSLVINDNWQETEIEFEETNSIDFSLEENFSLNSNNEVKKLREEILVNDTTSILLDNDLRLARQEIRKLKMEILQQEVLLEQEISGLSRFNQLNKDRAGMAKIIALYFWGEPEHRDTDPIKMAEIVRREMKNYCNDIDIPKTDEALKRIISSIAPENVRRQGRRHKK